MRVIDEPLPGVKLIAPTVHEDHRGFFMESYNQGVFADLGIADLFVQDNHSRSTRGVLRGLHYQLGQPQAKLVRATRGSVYDVVVDIRRGSPTFGQWAGAELSEDNRRQFYAPVGFAHAFLVLSDVAEFQYKCSDFYSADDEHGLPWNDPDIAIVWPLAGLEPILSDRDRRWAPLASIADSNLPEFEK
ncbi:MAG: dTDP-4-dehydrorhamnose 3,5-epimerase [Acidobacteriota bacterium]|nr:dTDP-4-dehydrorhamnose 3,5-epimerase [Acidobacteriota bacterium]